VYGVVVSGEMSVTEYLFSSNEVERVAPAQPEPTIMTHFLEEDMFKFERRVEMQERGWDLENLTTVDIGRQGQDDARWSPIQGIIEKQGAWKG
jgi:hypothetical protein